jgi:hypothetical protein
MRLGKIRSISGWFNHEYENVITINSLDGLDRIDIFKNRVRMYYPKAIFRTYKINNSTMLSTYAYEKQI